LSECHKPASTYRLAPVISRDCFPRV
jgi:hypothetical protein